MGVRRGATSPSDIYSLWGLSIAICVVLTSRTCVTGQAGQHFHVAFYRAAAAFISHIFCCLFTQLFIALFQVWLEPLKPITKQVKSKYFKNRFLINLYQ